MPSRLGTAEETFSTANPSRADVLPSNTMMAHRIRVPSKLPRLQEPDVRSLFALPSHQTRAIRPAIGAQQRPVRLSSSTAISQRQEIAPAKPTPGLGSLPLTWPHKGWDDKVVLEVVPSHREPRTLSDQIAWRVIRLCRYVEACTSCSPAPTPYSLIFLSGLTLPQMGDGFCDWDAPRAKARQQECCQAGFSAHDRVTMGESPGRAVVISHTGY